QVVGPEFRKEITTPDHFAFGFIGERLKTVHYSGGADRIKQIAIDGWSGARTITVTIGVTCRVAKPPDFLAGLGTPAANRFAVAVLEHGEGPTAGHGNARVTFAGRLPPQLFRTIIGPDGEQILFVGNAVPIRTAPLRPVTGGIGL